MFHFGLAYKRAVSGIHSRKAKRLEGMSHLRRCWLNGFGGVLVVVVVEVLMRVWKACLAGGSVGSACLLPRRSSEATERDDLMWKSI